MKSKELKIYNLPEERVVLDFIDAKPNFMIFAIFVIGLLLTIIGQIIWSISLLLFSFFAISMMPNRVLVEFCHDYLILYNHANKVDCEIIYYEDVVKWKYSSGLNYDTLSICLVDDSVHKIDGFSRLTFEKLMNKYLKDKKEKKKSKKQM